jgi:hypothetical protein
MTFLVKYVNTNMDDIRAIDWNVTARYKTHVKVFEEERVDNDADGRYLRIGKFWF